MVLIREQKWIAGVIRRDVFKIYSASGCYLYRRFKNEVRLSQRRKNVFGITIRRSAIEAVLALGLVGEPAASLIYLCRT